MGIVVPFTDFKRTRSFAGATQACSSGPELSAITTALRASGDTSAVLRTAKPLLDQCRDRYGFVLMRDGLPQDPKLCSRSLLELYQGLCLLDTAMGAPRTYPSYGVYLGRPALAWFEDGYSGETGLAVPNDVSAAQIASYIAPRVTSRRVQSKD